MVVVHLLRSRGAYFESMTRCGRAMGTLHAYLSVEAVAARVQRGGDRFCRLCQRGLRIPKRTRKRKAASQ